LATGTAARKLRKAQANNVIGQWSERLGENIANPGIEDQADQHRHECHERQYVADNLIDCATSGLEEDTNDAPHDAAGAADKPDKAAFARLFHWRRLFFFNGSSSRSCGD